MKTIELRAPNADVVEKLEILLEQGRSGKILGFTCVTDLQGGISGTWIGGMIHRPIQIGQLELLKMRILREWNADPEDEP